MALYKPVRQDDGVITNYHRILYMTQTVNKQNTIAVLSYVDNEARAAEADATIAQPYTKAVTYECGYDEHMTVSSAYDYLKTLPLFYGSEDI